jgi:hypothetical protein
MFSLRAARAESQHPGVPLMTAVSLRIVAPDQKTLARAVAQLQHQLGVTIPMPNHPGRKGDWLTFFSFEVYIPPDEPTRRRPAGHGTAASQ